MFFDTIVAPVTGAPPAGVAIVRLSGPESWSIAQELFSPWPDPVVPKLATYGHMVTGESCLMLPFQSPASFTGEDTVEFQIHGSRAGIEATLNACLTSGARMARPGEFSERAYLNGKMDLTQAESIRDMIESVTDIQLAQASLLQKGLLTQKTIDIRSRLESALADIEAHVDFSEELGDLDKSAVLSTLAEARGAIERLLSTAEPGRFLREGLRIVLTGRPNSGKSSLLNALLGRNRAIVSATPGTTRDYVEETTELGGVLVTLIDTAGLREATDTVEQEGVRRAKELISSADVVWALFDLTQSWHPDDQVMLEAVRGPVLRIGTKCDLPFDQSEADQADVLVSVTSGKGLDALGTWAQTFTGLEVARSEPLIRPRHKPHLMAAMTSLQGAVDTLSQDLPFDLAAVCLQDALREMRAITGESSDPDWVERIFRDFCIGK